MSEPPALPEPIKPPRGDFSLEERKWREGITRAINILTEEMAHKVPDTIFSDNNTWTGSNHFKDIYISELADFKGSALYFGNYEDANKYSTIYGYSGDVDSLTLWATIGYRGGTFNFSPTDANSTAQLGISGYPWNAVYSNSVNTELINSVNPPSGNFVVQSTGRVYLKSYSTTPANTTSLVFGAKTVIPETNLDINLGHSSYRFKNIYGNVIDLTYISGTGATVRSNQRLYLTSYYGETSETTLYMGGNSLVPEVDNTVSLGVNGYTWASGYFNGATISSTEIVPTINEYGTLGNSSYRWKTYYGSEIDLFEETDQLGIPHLAEIHSNYTLYLTAFTGSAYETKLVIGNKFFAPSVNNTVSLGTSSKEWANVYTPHVYTSVSTGNGLLLESAGRVTFRSYSGGTSETTIYLGGKTLSPNKDVHTNLGYYNGSTADYSWGDVYCQTIHRAAEAGLSDRRLKSEIEPLENALPKLNTIEVKSYKMKNVDIGISYGLIANEELQRNPELIVVPENYSEEEGGGELGYLCDNVLFLAVKAIQELSDKVTELEGKYGNIIKNS